MNLVLLKEVVALLTLFGGGPRELGTIFGSSRWDSTNPNSRLACYHRQIDDGRDMLVAHNVLPCKTPLLLFNPRTHLATVALVGDRGPRHADIDLSKLVARRLKHNGREEIVVMPLVPIDGSLALRPPAGATALPIALHDRWRAEAELDAAEDLEAAADLPPLAPRGR